MDRASLSKTLIESGIINEPHPSLSPNLNPNFDDSGWSYCTEEQLEDILLKNLDFLYNEAVSKLLALGYDEETALRAVLRNGHCYSGMDVLTNVLHNSLTYLNSGGDGSGNVEGSDDSFVNLRQLEEYSLAAMVCLLQQVKPHLTRGDAMWCLLMSDLHVGRASVMEIPSPSSGSCNGCNNPSPSKVESVDGGDEVGVSPAVCRFHRGWDFGNGPNRGVPDFPVDEFLSFAAETCLQKEIECPKRFNLSPSMKSLLKKNVAAFAAGFRSKSDGLPLQSQPCANLLSNGDSSGVEVPVEQNKEVSNVKNSDVVGSLLSKFDGLNLEEEMENVPEEQKDEMIMSLVNQVKDLEGQVKERKEWAQQKAMQAARKLSNDLTELKTLRMEREETQRLKKGKQTLEDTTLKRLSEMENALRKASGQVDRANAAVRRLETENAEIRAEMEASKLSASESVTTCLEVAKREKKCLKRLLAWEKQKSKMQEDIAVERARISERQQQLVKIEAAQKDFEVKWKQELKAKELALVQVEEEQRLKEAAEASNKRKLETLRLKTDIDFQCHKDDLLRLEHELSQLQASALSPLSSDTVSFTSIEGARSQGEGIARLLHEFDKWEDSSEREGTEERECLFCMKDEVSVVFLPCAHQVLCSSCNEGYGKKGRATCPCCRTPIKQRIRVFGASS